MTTSFTTGMRRRQNLRVVLFVIILATLPFYCAGIFLWGTAPQTTGQRTPTGSATVRATVTPLPTRTPGGFATLPGGFPTSGPLPNTPGNFFPPPIQPTFVFPPTVVFPATSTPAPTLTPPVIPPTATQPPAATATTIPIIDTPIPDTDGDGVPDNFDPCPNDPWPGTGCPPPPTADPGITPSDTPLPISP
jgi:hypothetical protein